ncbi:Upstream-binding protein 1 [Larimichthys crocea]|uniref:Uncharacterized protein n=1 Tax=Larimichthys crocea TaxID=215358 RepID=A0ACD3RF90_LARCR|nr:Upstream-binding protein 1 [Larimichthys crocea]
MAWVLKMDDASIESGLVHDFDASLSGIGQELGAGAYSMSDVLALPIFKQEDSSLPPENETKNPPFQYVLCAATSPAVKLHDETLTYLNQGQSYEVRMLDNRKAGELPEITNKMVKCEWCFMTAGCSTQSTSSWRAGSGIVLADRLLDIGNDARQEMFTLNVPYIPMSVGIVEPKTHPSQLNAAEFLWDMNKRTSVFVQVHCISTEFTPRKHGGEKGVPFRIQFDTFAQGEGGEYTEHLHSASCQIKVFKPKGADRKQKTDREKMEKRTPQEKEKYQPSYDTTILSETRLEPIIEDAGDHELKKSSKRTLPADCGDSLAKRGSCSPWPDNAYVSTNQAATPSFSSTPLSTYTTSSVPDSDSSSPNHQADPGSHGNSEVSVHSIPRSVRPRLTVYVCQESPRESPLLERHATNENGEHSISSSLHVYHALYLEELTAAELIRKMAYVCSLPLGTINQVYRQGPTGIHILLSDQMVYNLPDESCFLISTVKDELGEGLHLILK